jgi:hypothetical protein
MNAWLPAPALLTATATAAAAEIAGAYEAQKSSLISALLLLQAGLIQTFQSFDELECGLHSSVDVHLDVEMKCMGPTYLGRRSFCDWASMRYPQMENFIFQPHSLGRSSEQRVVDVLFATQAGFLCALHADAVLAPELHSAGASSICSRDVVISLTEVFHPSESVSDGSTMSERLILLSDIVQRLLLSAEPASGAPHASCPSRALSRCHQRVVQMLTYSAGNDVTCSVCHGQRIGNEGD